MNEENLQLLEKHKIWEKDGKEYELLAFTTQWVIIEAENGKEMAWRIDALAPRNFFNEFKPK